jgi:exodeoxyribonuclease VII small subunit
MTLEASLARLEEIAVEIRKDDVTITRQSELYAEGTALADECEKALGALRHDVRMIDLATGEEKPAPELEIGQAAVPA